MAPARLARPPTCLDCLRRLARQPTSPTSPFPSLSLTQQQTRGVAVKKTKAELEDLQGIPVRLLQDVQGFGRKHAIIRVKPGRMRNYWFPKAQAEYMTRKRFQELGLTEAAIGVRDRTFGVRLLLEEDKSGKGVLVEEGPSTKKTKKEILTLPPEETLTLLQTILPQTLTFARKPIHTPAATPETPRSPSLAVNAAVSTAPDTPEPSEPASVAIFGSVSANDILALIREKLLAVDATQGGRVALEAEDIVILGLNEDGESQDADDRIKRLGLFEVLIWASRDLEPVRREIEVVAEE